MKQRRYLMVHAMRLRGSDDLLPLGWQNNSGLLSGLGAETGKLQDKGLGCRCGAVQCNAVQCSKVWCSAAQGGFLFFFSLARFPLGVSRPGRGRTMAEDSRRSGSCRVDGGRPGRCRVESSRIDSFAVLRLASLVCV
jgi:hypothetical protein